MKNSLLLAVMVCLLIPTGCSGPKSRVNEEGPWYSEDIYLCSNYHKHQNKASEHPYKHQKASEHPFGVRPKVPEVWRWSGSRSGDGRGPLVGKWTKHTVPIVCGSKDGECGIINCDCICHK